MIQACKECTHCTMTRNCDEWVCDHPDYNGMDIHDSQWSCNDFAPRGA